MLLILCADPPIEWQQGPTAPIATLLEGEFCAAFCGFFSLPRSLSTPGSAGKKSTSFARALHEQRVALCAQTALGAPSARSSESGANVS